jgi:hypothetical protein
MKLTTKLTNPANGYVVNTGPEGYVVALFLGPFYFVWLGLYGPAIVWVAALMLVTALFKTVVSLMLLGWLATHAIFVGVSQTTVAAWYRRQGWHG